MSKLLKPFLAIGNAIVKWLLRSRFHRLLSGKVVLLEITGRKSGRKYLVPVNYRAAQDGISVMTYRRRQWWRNLRQADALPVYLKGRKLIMTPEVVLDDPGAIAQGLIDRGWVRKSIAPAAAGEAVLVRLRLSGKDKSPAPVSRPETGDGTG